MAKAKRFDVGAEFLDEARYRLKRQHLSHIISCLRGLSDEEIWWRPNESSNSVGNLVLHLCGNVRQWIISGVGGAVDVRNRDLEFSEQGPLPRQGLIVLLRGAINEACYVLAHTPTDSLGEPFIRQGFRTTRLRAIAHVVEHFAYHTGQIIYVTKLKGARDLRFTRLPKAKKAARAKAGAGRGRRKTTRRG
jgi:uncharacterized damage-inducible protein DinB